MKPQEQGPVPGTLAGIDSEKGHMMAAKKGQAKTRAKRNANVVGFPRRPDESERDSFGRNSIRPTVGGALTIKAYSGKYGDGLEIMGLVTALSDQAKAVNDGDLKRAEVMLMVQAHTLDAIFNELAQRAARQQYLPQFEAHMRLALKAQSQCRATLETVATIKNPPVIYARQANVTTGAQQVNNGMAAPSHAREIETEQSQLSGGSNELLPDSRTSALAGRIDPPMAAVGEIDWAENQGG